MSPRMRTLSIALGALSLVASACVLAVTQSSSAAPAKHRPGAEASASAPRAPAPPPADPAIAARADYADHRGELETSRKALAKRLASAKGDPARDSVMASARTTLLDALKADLFPAWIGTAWDFNGTSQKPGEGKIACGYFVTTVLLHAGFRVERAKLAQQASENIVKTLVGAHEIWRFREGDADAVIAKVDELGQGLYVVGLDNHVGFLVERNGESTRFCHASYLEPVTVQCEVARDAAAFASTYHVVGRVTNDATLTHWLEGDTFKTVAPR